MVRQTDNPKEEKRGKEKIGEEVKRREEKRRSEKRREEKRASPTHGDCCHQVCSSTPLAPLLRHSPRCSSASPPRQLSPLWIESRSHQSLLHPSYSRARSLDRASVASVSPSALERTRIVHPRCSLIFFLLPFPSFHPSVCFHAQSRLSDEGNEEEAVLSLDRKLMCEGEPRFDRRQTIKTDRSYRHGTTTLNHR